MRALVLNCTLKGSPPPSNTQALADVVIAALRADGVEVEVVRVVDHHIPPGVETDLGEGDEWPRLHDVLLHSDILVMATPTWLGQPSSVAKLVLERMDAMISETKQDGTHHVISEVAGALVDIGFTIPAQAWTYWNMGTGPGPSYTETDHKHDWSESTGRTMAANLLAAATALRAHPMPPAG